MKIMTKRILIFLAVLKISSDSCSGIMFSRDTEEKNKMFSRYTLTPVPCKGFRGPYELRKFYIIFFFKIVLFKFKLYKFSFEKTYKYN